MGVLYPNAPKKSVRKELKMSELDSIVEIMLNQIKEEFKSPSFNVWFGELKLTHLDEKKAIFSTPSDIRKKFLSTKYLPMISSALTTAIGFEVEIEIVSTEKKEETVSEEDIPKYTEEQKAEASEREQHINEFLLKSEGDSKSLLDEYTFDNFIEGDSNKFARAACLAVAMEPATSYNPLFIYGNSGLGKTHLLYAIINYIRKNHPHLKIVYKKSEDFINELITALVVNKNTAEFKNKYRSADVLLIDDIQFIAGKESTQDEFFHTFSALYEAGKQIILTSDRPPKEIKPLSDRLRTRFEGGLLADVQKPSFELRIAIIKKKSASLNMSISNELVNYMAERLQHDIRQIEGALKKLKALYLINGLSITKESIDNVISSIDPGNIPTDVLVEKILTTVAKYYGVRVEDILSKSKTDNIAYARHISVYVIKKLTDLSYKAIGSFIGGRDHSTVISSYNKVEQYISTKKNTESDIKKIIRDVKG